MKTLRIIKTGKIVQVENGLAHGMIDRGEAEIVYHSKSEERRLKEMEKAPKDKMLHPVKSKVRNK